MKKILAIVLMFFISFFMYSCGNENPDVNDKKDDVIDYTSELETSLALIKEEIPESFTADYSLPVLDTYSVSYSITGTEIVDNKIIYNNLGYDYNCLLTIVVSFESNSVTGYTNIIMTGDQAKIDAEITSELQGYLDDFTALLPASISENYQLPELVIGDGVTKVVRVTTSMQSKNKVYQYSYPETDENFKIEVRLAKNGVTLSKTYNIPVLSGETKNKVPRIYLTTKNNATIQKDDYVNGTFSLQEKNDNNEWATTLNSLEMKIKGRGNSTWGFDKKPYKIKFSEKVSLFGEKKAKTWTLIANYIDHSLMRNYAAYYLGRSLDGLAHTTCAYFVDVYLNGEYRGNYLLCEQTEVDKNRLNITEDDTKTNTGYLVEMDQKFFESNTGVEGTDYFYLKMHNKDWLFAMQTPDPEESSIITDQVTYIKSYFESLIKELIKNTDDIYDYLDLDSAVDSFIVQELTKNKDQGWSSFYMYKDVGGKLYFGPIWDFDLSSLGQGNISSSDRAVEGWYTDTGYYNPFYKYLLKNSTFKKALKARMNEIYNVQIKNMIDELTLMKDYIHYSALQNFKLWDVIGKDTRWYISTEVHETLTWEGQVDLLIKYYKDRSKWMLDAVNKW